MHPKDAGFDEYALYHALHTEDKGSRYTSPTMLEGTAGSDGTVKKYDGRYGEDVWVEKIVRFFEQHRDEPTFVYYPMALPHWPFEPTPNTPGWNPNIKQPEDYRYITDMIEYMDTAVGNLLTELSKRELDRNTIVIFYSDNGTHAEVNSKMKDGRTIRGGKATPKQTGIHVPLIARWPGHFSPGVDDEIVDASEEVRWSERLTVRVPRDELTVGVFGGDGLVEAIDGQTAVPFPIDLVAFPLAADDLAHSLAPLDYLILLESPDRGVADPLLDWARSGGRVLVTSQNHGFSVEPPDMSLVSHMSLNDDTVEGLVGDGFRSVQFHPEAAPGTSDAFGFFEDLRVSCQNALISKAS